MYVYRKSFLPYVDDNTARAAVLFQMLERFLVHSKKRVASVNNGHECTRTIRYFHLQDSIDIAEERVATMTNAKWLVNWVDLRNILNRIRSNYIEPYGENPKQVVPDESTEEEIHSRQVRRVKTKMYKLHRQSLFRTEWLKGLQWN